MFTVASADGAAVTATPTLEALLKASDLFVKALKAEQVEYIFGIPGEENLGLLESLRSVKSCRDFSASTIDFF